MHLTLPPARRRFLFGGCPLLLAIGGALVLVFGIGAETQPNLAGKLERIKPTEPANALETFEVHEGFHLDLLAAEPMVTDAISMDFDARGRLFVTEMRGYSERRDQHLGRVRRLTDSDGDGKPDQSTIFAKGLPWPTAVFCWDGGVFVGAAPDLFYMKDTDGDGKADVKKKVLTGFGTGNVQQLFNTFTWGLDNRIHMSVGRSGGEIRRPDQPESEAINVRGNNLAFDPKTYSFKRTSGYGQWGIGFTDWGDVITSTNSDHFQMIFYEQGYVERNPYLKAPNPTRSIAASGPQGPVYRISKVPQWRIIRTKMRVAGEVGGLVEGRGRAAGYFSASTATTPYRGDAYPKNMRNQVFLGDVSANVVSRKKLTPNGVGFIGKRIDPGKEFIASRDPWFRPVAISNAPDGTLWIADMYRQITEHPESLPPSIKKHKDLSAGMDRGRLYRLAPDGFEPRAIPNLAEKSTEALVKLLGHRNKWHHKTASRLLYQRRDKAAIDPLRQMAREGDSPIGRLHALATLEGMDALTADILLKALNDEHPRVREHAVQLSEDLLGESSALREKLLSMTDDPHIRVRYQLAFTLGELESANRYPALVEILKQNPSSRWIRLACFSSMAGGWQPVLASLVEAPGFTQTEGGRGVLEELARQLAAARGADAVPEAAQRVKPLTDDRPEAAVAILRGLGAGLGEEAGSIRETLRKTGARDTVQLIEGLLNRAERIAQNAERPTTRRVTAIHTLTLKPFAEAKPALTSLLKATEPAPVQRAAVEALASYQAAGVAKALLGPWSNLGPAYRRAAMDALLARRQRVNALLDAIEADQFDPSHLKAQDVQRLNFFPHGKTRHRARRLLVLSKTGSRQKVVAKYRDAVARLEGDPESGRKVFSQVCAACHQAAGMGHKIGPSIRTFVQRRGVEAFLINVLDPNREINPQYFNYIVQTTDGRTLTGMLTAESANSIILTRANGSTSEVLRSKIKSMRSLGISLMPQALEKKIPPQKMADLTAFMLSLNGGSNNTNGADKSR